MGAVSPALAAVSTKVTGKSAAALSLLFVGGAGGCCARRRPAASGGRQRSAIRVKRRSTFRRRSPLGLFNPVGGGAQPLGDFKLFPGLVRPVGPLQNLREQVVAGEVVRVHLQRTPEHTLGVL